MNIDQWIGAPQSEAKQVARAVVVTGGFVALIAGFALGFVWLADEHPTLCLMIVLALVLALVIYAVV